MKVLKVVILLFLQISLQESKILENEQKLLKSLIDHFQIRRCLIINEFEEFISFAKFLSTNHVSAGFLNTNLLARHVIPDTYPDILNMRDFPTKTAVIWKSCIHTFLVDFSGPLGFGQKFMSRYIWIIITDSSDWNDLEYIDVPFDCIFLIIKPNSGFHYQIFKAHKIKPNIFPNMKVEVFGGWDVEYGLVLKESRRKPDFHNEQLLLCTYRIDIKQSPVLSKTLEIWYDLGKMMNFSTYELSLYEADYLGLDTRFNGVDMDASIIPATKTSSVIPMIYPMWLKKVYMHVKYEGNEITNLEALLRPFTFNVWITILLAHIVSTATIIIVEFITLKINDNQCRTFHFVDSLFAPLEMMFNQGGSEPLDRPSPRISYLSLWIQISILLPAYTGAVVSFLTMIIPQVPFSDLDTFIENGAYKFTGVSNTYMKGYFYWGKEEGNAKAALIYDKFFINASLMPLSLEEGVHQVCSGKKLVLLSYENEAFENLFQQEPKCKLLKIPKPIFSVAAGLPLNVLSPFGTAFNKQFTYFRTSGILEKLNRDLSQKRTELQMDDYDPIEFTQIIPLLQFLSVLTVLSLLIYLCEKIIGDKRIRL